MASKVIIPSVLSLAVLTAVGTVHAQSYLSQPANSSIYPPPPPSVLVVPNGNPAAGTLRSAPPVPPVMTNQRIPGTAVPAGPFGVPTTIDESIAPVKLDQPNKAEAQKTSAEDDKDIEEPEEAAKKAAKKLPGEEEQKESEEAKEKEAAPEPEQEKQEDNPEVIQKSAPPEVQVEEVPPVPEEEQEKAKLEAENPTAESSALGADPLGQSSQTLDNLNSPKADSTIDETIKQAEQEQAIDKIINQAEVYLYGDGVPVDLAKAAGLYARAVEMGSPKAMMRLSTMYRRGTGVEKDLNRAFTLTQQAAEAGYVPAMAALGFLYRDGIGIGRNETLSKHWIDKAAENGHVFAMIMSSEQLSKLTHDPDAMKKAQDYKDLAKQYGTPQELYTISYSYGHGLRLPRDVDKAMEWAKIAADKGGVNAMYYLGECYWNRQNPQEAIVWFEKAAEKGLEPAQLQTGRLYRDGTKGIQKNPVKAAFWLQKAASLLNKQDLFSLVQILQRGPKEVRDTKKADEWLELFIKKSTPKELNDLADQYWAGQGVRRNFDLGGALALGAIAKGDRSKVCQYAQKLATPNWTHNDYVTAYALLNQCSLGSEDPLQYKRALDEVENRMNSEQLKEAQNLEANEALDEYLKKTKPSVQ